jgi:AP2 domain
MKIERVHGYPGLFHEELGKEGSRFRIKIQRNRKPIQEYFFFGIKRTEAIARAEAIARWKELRKKYPVISRVAFAEIERRKGQTGIVGVRKVTKIVKGHEYRSWVGWWSDRRHNRRCHSFSVEKYGNEEAKKMAIQARREGLAQLAE